MLATAVARMAVRAWRIGIATIGRLLGTDEHLRSAALGLVPGAAGSDAAARAGITDQALKDREDLKD
jgi:hypothetical protein